MFNQIKIWCIEMESNHQNRKTTDLQSALFTTYNYQCTINKVKFSLITLLIVSLPYLKNETRMERE